MIGLLEQYWPLLLEGFINTLIVSIIALLSSLIIGTIMGMLQLSANKIVRTIVNIYVEFFRNIPLLITVMFFYVVVPMYWMNISGFASGIIGLTFYISSFISYFICEVILTFHCCQTYTIIYYG